MIDGIDSESDELLRSLPSVNSVLNHPAISKIINKQGRELVTYAVRRVVAHLRDSILEGKKTRPIEEILADVEDMVDLISRRSLKPVINATGIVLHTNLGRAPLGREVIAEISQIAEGYSNLEYDLENCCRGKRDRHIADILSFLTSAEDAIVVNNNAAGIMLALNTLACGREVIISRGELIEIGGSFRIPEIIDASGVQMVEVGTTNRTRLSDYEAAINPHTALLFKAHNSNFAMIGFTESACAQDLANLAHARNLPMVFDLGSGLLKNFGGAPLQNEPDVRSAIASGVDLVLFSCDKLLGGPQAGIVAGRKSLISRLRKSPLMRVVRVGKLTLAALSAVCRQYLDDKELYASCPTHAILRRSPAELKSIASQLLGSLQSRGISSRLSESQGQCGGGTLPGISLKSYAVEILPQNGKSDGKVTFAEKLFSRLQSLDRPIVGVLRGGRILFDVLTLFEKDLEYISCSISDSIDNLGSQRDA